MLYLVTRRDDNFIKDEQDVANHTVGLKHLLYRQLVYILDTELIPELEYYCVIKREYRRRLAARLGVDVELRHAVSHYL